MNPDFDFQSLPPRGPAYQAHYNFAKSARKTRVWLWVAIVAGGTLVAVVLLGLVSLFAWGVARGVQQAEAEQQATDHNERGNRYVEQGKNDKAIAEYTQAIRLQPNLAIAYYNRGNSYLRAREYDKALADFN